MSTDKKEQSMHSVAKDPALMAYVDDVWECAINRAGRQTFAECACIHSGLPADPPIQQACIDGFNFGNNASAQWGSQFPQYPENPIWNYGATTAQIFPPFIAQKRWW